MVTIKEVAAKAGVSVATVSRVLNSERVRPETRQRVMAAIRELGYVPNRMARSLKTQKSKCIGFVVPDFGAFFMGVAAIVENVLNQHGYDLIVCNSGENPAREADRICMLMERQVDGLLVVPTGNRTEHLEAVRARGVPVVLLDRLIKGFETDSVLTDNVYGAYMAVEHLVKAGYRRIAVVTGRLDVTTGEERYRGYLRVLEDYGIQLDEEIVKKGDFSTKSGYLLVKELMSLARPPEAIFVSNCYMTVGVLLAFDELGVRVPEDVALVAFDDMELFRVAASPLTVVVQPVEQMGVVAASTVYQRVIGDSTGFPTMHRLKPSLIVRSSSGAKTEPGTLTLGDYVGAVRGGGYGKV